MYRIRRAFGVHESGTKFYQVFLIESDDSPNGVTVVHYGKNESRAIKLPLSLGQSEVAAVGTHASADKMYNKKLKDKRARGYKFEDSVIDNFDRDAFLSAVSQIFKPNEVKEIVGNLCSGVEFDRESNTPVMPKKRETTADIREDWGEW
ncbi:WGR domain-containing protein [Methyloversatilis sp.]|uniref:WGR domain-containing protein n=1 Tax=Methyloversatilis sp. TaxID=2569862 RepID=UPI0035B29CCB